MSQTKPAAQTQNPILEIFDKEGDLRMETHGVILATMYFPNDEEKRRQFSFALLKESYSNVLPPEKVGKNIRLTRKFLAKLLKAKTIEEMKMDEDAIIQKGILIGHWLHFRIWAAQNEPKLNSSTKWDHLLDNVFLPQLRPNNRKGSVPLFGTKTNIFSANYKTKLRTEFVPVAHLWAAALHNHRLRARIPKDDYRKQRMRHGIFQLKKKFSPRSEEDFLGFAESYRRLAEELGIYEVNNASYSDKIWLIPEGIELSDIPAEVFRPIGLPIDFDVDDYITNQYENPGTTKTGGKKRS
jgi:hypothetical protein